MVRPQVVIFGGPPEQLHEVAEQIAYYWAVSIFPPGRMPTENDIEPLPNLVLFLPENPSDECQPLLQAIQNNLPGVPIVMIAKDPKKEDIIRAFRLGVKDYLLFPPEAAALQSALSRSAIEGPISSSGFSFRGWKARLQRWLQEKWPQPNHGRPGGRRKNNLELALQGIFLPSAREKKPQHGVAVQFLGEFRIWVEGKELPLLPGEKINAFFAYLLYHHRKTVHREVLLSRFWEYTSPTAARKSLNVAMHRLRSHLSEYFPDMELLQYYNDSYSINPELEISTDADQFLELWHKGRAVDANHGPEKALEHYQKAAHSYKGDFLEHIHYEEWCEQERDNLKETYLILLDRLGTYFLQEEACVPAQKVFKKMLEKDACLENVHRKLILCYYRMGHRDKAIRQYYKCVEVLQKELNIEPSVSTKELFQLISQDKDSGISSFLI